MVVYLGKTLEQLIADYEAIKASNKLMQQQLENLAREGFPCEGCSLVDTCGSVRGLRHWYNNFISGKDPAVQVRCANKRV